MVAPLAELAVEERAGKGGDGERREEREGKGDKEEDIIKQDIENGVWSQWFQVVVSKSD